MRPTPALVLLFLAALATALLPVFFGVHLVPFWLVTVGVLLLLAGLDALLALPRRRLDAEVEAPERVAIGETGEARAKLRAANAHRRTRLAVAADVGGEVSTQRVRRTRLDEGGATDLSLPFTPRRRGRVSFEALWIRWTGPLGLVRWTKRVPLDVQTAVVPNVGAARREAIRLLRRRDAWTGTKVVRHVGEGSEFESLREYVPGLDPRAMNWKASARHRQLITTEYRDERNHQIVLALDTGHLMGEPLDGIPKLDLAATSALVLAYASLRHGDRVGAFAFDEGVRDWVEPRGGVQQLSRLQRFAADAEYGTGETNYTLGLAELSARLHRRSFVVVFTEFVDTVTAELMIENTARLARRHLITFVTLRDPYLATRIDAPPTGMADLYGAVVADDFARERELVLQRLRRQGVFCIDASAADLSTRLLNRYLHVKRRELVG